MLKAAVPVGGRAISLYEQVFPFKRYNSPGAHREFLRALHAVLPPDCAPSSSRTPDFVGPGSATSSRTVGTGSAESEIRIKYYREETARWRFTDSVYPEATSVPRYIGEVTLSRRHQYRFRLYLVRAHRPRIGRPPQRGPKQPNTTLYQRLHRAPWLLTTSLPHGYGSKRRVMQLSRQRMQIEETFRDLKCHRWGFGLRYAHSNSTARLEILLLLGALATLVVWLVGLAAHALQLNRNLQANTERRRDVLSTFFIGRELLRRLDDLPRPVIDLALLTLRHHLSSARPA